MTPEYLRSVISDDFDATLWVSEKDSLLFGAARKDLWHFIRADYSEAEEGFSNTNINQVHLSRYEIACDVQALLFLHKQRKGTGIREKLVVSESGIAICNNGRFDLRMLPTKAGLSKEISAEFEAECEILERARSQLKHSGGVYILPRHKTFSKKPVSSESLKLMEAIAFEKEVRGKLNYRDFGIYSAFCTLMDFCIDKPVDLSEIRDHIEGQFSYDPADIGEGFRNLAMDVQSKLFERPIWGPGIDMAVDEAIASLAKVMSRLSSVQRAQFVLMNGMHGAGLFLPLAVVSDVASFEDYISWKTSHLQPDSNEEQSIRRDVAYIKLLGDLSH